jgi:hypothetical protein
MRQKLPKNKSTEILNCLFINHYKMDSLVSSMSKMTLSGMSNLGGKQLKFVAKDDAVHVGCYRVDDGVSGTIVMPFRHAEFAKQYYA